MQYAGYLSARALRSLPEATSIGNHDSMTIGYQNHFNVPNPFTEEATPTPAGHGYFYSYGNALFIVINANNYNAADHEALIKKAIKSNPNAKWRIVVMHQDIYGSGLDHSDSDGILLHTQLTPIYDANKIDVVLQGHDHTYARTYQLSSDGKQHADFAEYKVAGQSGQHHNLINAALKDSAKKSVYESQNLCYTIADMRQGTLVNPKGSSTCPRTRRRVRSSISSSRSSRTTSRHATRAGVRRTPSSISRRIPSPSTRMTRRREPPSTRRTASSRTDPTCPHISP